MTQKYSLIQMSTYDYKSQKVLRGREEKSDIIDSLNKITDRNKRDLEVSIQILLELETFARTKTNYRNRCTCESVLYKLQK
jgi:hypothetical protein